MIMIFKIYNFCMAVAVKHVATPLSFASSILVLDVYE